MSKLSSEIGKRIRGYRTRLKLSQEELADKCRLHPTYIGQLERGEKNATIESVNKVAEGLNIPLSTLFENIEQTALTEKTVAGEAYDLIQTLPTDSQEKILEIIKTILEINGLYNA